MNRRDFMKGFAVGIALSYMGLKTRRYFLKKKNIKFNSLYQKKFKNYVEENRLNKNDLYAALREKNVINWIGVVDTSRVEKLALTDKLVEYNHFLYTETELQLYAFGYLLKSGLH